MSLRRNLPLRGERLRQSRPLCCKTTYFLRRPVKQAVAIPNRNRSQANCAIVHHCEALKGPWQSQPLNNSRLLRRKLLAMTQKGGLHPVNGYWLAKGWPLRCTSKVRPPSRSCQPRHNVKLQSPPPPISIRIHECRHTYASLLLQAGAPIHYVKEQLGHSSIATTVDLYGHVIPGANRSVLDRLD